MNIFFTDANPNIAARNLCDKHIPKMIVESAQMLGSALRRHGATDDMMPLTKKGTPYKGGYHNHPSTKWVGDSRANYIWMLNHAFTMSMEYSFRFGKRHFCHTALEKMNSDACVLLIPAGNITKFARAFNKELYPQLYDEEKFSAVEAYREYYHLDKRRFAKWEKGTPAPYWWVK